MSTPHNLPTKNPKPASRIGNVFLLLVSVATTLLAVEVGYRIYLQRRTILTFNATNKPIYEYSASSGYGYAPNTDAVCVYIRGGELYSYDSVVVGPYGNLGNGVDSWGDEDFKILAFGDSFTANLYKYFSWADHIAEPLRKAIGRNVEVMNLGRDGFGILQIMRLANNTLKHTKADLVVIAFISDDLDRARNWRTKLNINGMERTLMSIQQSPSPTSTPDIQSSTDIVLINSKITLEWCSSAYTSQKKDDPILAALHAQCQSLVPDNFTKGFSTPTISFLYNRIRYGDPFHTIRKLPVMPRIDFQDYRQDAEFVEDVRGLMSQPVPVLIVMLPWYPELKAGTFLLNDERKSLLSSLNELTEGKIVSAFDCFDKPPENLEEMFFVPVDQHPTALGAQRYARAIVNAIQSRSGALRKKPAGEPAYNATHSLPISVNAATGSSRATQK